MGKAKFGAKRKESRPVGDIRQSQLITTYGVGSIINFVKDTVIISGVDDWDTGKNSENIQERKIYNDNLQALTGAKYFLEPKVSDNYGWVKTNDIPAYTFPEMLYCPTCKKIVSAKEAANANPKKANKCFMTFHDGKSCPGYLIASRFVVACENGHLDDFPYDWWIHGENGCDNNKRPLFSMYNKEDRSDLESLVLKCENCGKSRSMEHIFSKDIFSNYKCKGNHPHLAKAGTGDSSPTDCDKVLKTMLRSSSGVYFPILVSALSIPPWSREAVKIIEREYETISYVDKSKLNDYLQNKTTATVNLPKLLDALQIVTSRKSKATVRKEMDILLDEYNVLSNGTSSDDEGEYSAYEVDVPNGFEKYFNQITVVDRLTVIQALKGFTRVYPWSEGYDFTDKNKQKIAPLSSYPKEWLPAISLRGEGIYISFHKKAMDSWRERIKDRYDKMLKNLNNSMMSHRLDRFSPEYVLLHTFSHLLIRQLSNECGYSTASIREKIYSTFKTDASENPQMSGVLIYLTSSDCDGSLGGLISIAQNPERLGLIFTNMIQKASWCSADPLCVSSIDQGFESLNYSACHDCLLLPETSCEFRNLLLDRVSIVGIPEDRKLGFMGDLV